MHLVQSFLAFSLCLIILDAQYANAVSNSTLTRNEESALESGKSCRCVAFRLDDIQDYFLTNVQVGVINTLEKKNANVTIGIIGNSFGDDLFLVQFLKEKIVRNNNGSNSFHLEVANHGWNHEDFARIDENEQSSLIYQTNEKIVHILGIKPDVFIPPFNALNNYTILALSKNDMHYTSTNATSYPPTILAQYKNEANSTDRTTNLYRVSNFASAAVTGDLNADETEWLGYPHGETLTNITVSIEKLGYAVVTMHPMEFSIRNGIQYKDVIDREQVQELESLIDDIRAAGLRIVTISEIGQFNIGTVPEFTFYVHITLATSIAILILINLSNKGRLFARYSNFSRDRS